MEMVKLHMTKRGPERKRDDKKIDLDERIRRIKEENKAREKRFREIEHDRLQASSGDIQNQNDGKGRQENAPAVKGVMGAGGQKTTIGRGQRLLKLSKEPLKAKEFETRLRENLKKINPQSESKSVTQINKSLSKNIGQNKSQPSVKENEVLLDTKIPSVGYNPLMNHKFINKSNPKKGYDHEWNETKQENERQKGNGFTGYRHDRTELKKTQDSSWKKENSSQGRELTTEDWNAELMDVHELSTEPMTAPKPKVLAEQPMQEILTGSDKENIKKDLGLSDNSNVDENNTPGCNEHRMTANPEKICEVFHEQAVSQDSENVDKNENVHGSGNSKEVLIGECCVGWNETMTMIPEEPEKSKESSMTEVTNSKTKSSNQEKNPKITVNTTLKKTLSNSSFDESMSMLSPLDVPGNWGDCDYDESLNNAFLFNQETLSFNYK